MPVNIPREEDVLDDFSVDDDDDVDVPVGHVERR
jgi:hypothetical protein